MEAKITGRLWSAWWRGISQHSWSSLAICLTVAVGLLWCGTAWIDETFVVENRQMFALGSSDPPLETMARLQQLSRATSPSPSLFVIGDLSSPIWRETLDALSPQQRWLDLTFPGQTLWESMVFLDRLPAGIAGDLILDLQDERAYPTPKDLRVLLRSPRFPLRSRALDKEVFLAGLSAPALSGNFFWDNQQFFFQRAGALLLGNILKSNSPSRGNLAYEDDSQKALRTDVARRALDLVRRRTDLRTIVLCSRVDAFPASSNSPDKSVDERGYIVWLNVDGKNETERAASLTRWWREHRGEKSSQP